MARCNVKPFFRGVGGRHQTKGFCSVKGKNELKKYFQWEEIFSYYVSNNCIYPRFIKHSQNSATIKQLHRKMKMMRIGQQSFPQRKLTNGQQAWKRSFSSSFSLIIRELEDETPYQDHIPSYTSENGSLPKVKKLGRRDSTVSKALVCTHRTWFDLHSMWAPDPPPGMIPKWRVFELWALPGVAPN